MLVRRRLMPIGLLASAITLLSTAAAHANLLVAAGVNCSSPPMSQVFAPWADPASYTLAPGGDFSASGPSWNLSGGAQVEAGGDGYSLDGTPSTHSLSLPAGSSATSPSTCVGIENPDIRFFAINTGSPTSVLQVSVNYEDAFGDALSQTIGDITGSDTWEPTLQDPIVANLLPILPNAMTPVSFTFTPQDATGDWQIDDLYVDPWGGGG